MGKRVFLVGGVALLAIVLTACAPRAPTEIKIGLNAELTGSIPVVGASC